MKIGAIEVNSNEISIVDFQHLCADAGAYNASTGLGTFDFKGGKVVFVDAAGTKVAYYLSGRTGTTTAKFVCGAKIEAGKLCIAKSYSSSGAFVGLTTKDDPERDALKGAFDKVDFTAAKAIYDANKDATKPAIFEIQTPPAKGSKDNGLACVVVGKHPTKVGEKSLYIINLPKVDVEKMDLSDATKILSAGGIVVNHAVIDKTGVVKAYVYTGTTKNGTTTYSVSKTPLTLIDPNHSQPDNLKAFADAKYGVGKVKTRSEAAVVLKNSTHKTAGIVKGATVVTLIFTLVVGIFSGIFFPVRAHQQAVAAEKAAYVQLFEGYQTHSEDAYKYGQQQVETMLAGKSNLFGIQQSSATNHTITAADIEAVIQTKFADYVAVDYDKLTKEDQAKVSGMYYDKVIEGGASAVGELVAQYLVDNGVPVAARGSVNDAVVYNFVYPNMKASVPTEIVDVNAIMTHLTSVGVGYTQDQAAAWVASYEAGFRKVADNNISTNKTYINGVGEPIVINANDPTILQAVRSAIGTSGQVEMVFANIESGDKVLYALEAIAQGQYSKLYKIDIDDTVEIATQDDLKSAIETADVSTYSEAESRLASANNGKGCAKGIAREFKNLASKGLDAHSMYVAAKMVDGKMETVKIFVCVNANNEVVIVEQVGDTVEKTSNAVSPEDMIATSVFASYQAPGTRVDRKGNGYTIHEGNVVTQADASAIIASTAKDYTK